MARTANLIVEIDYEKSDFYSEHVVIIDVLHCPPKESLRIRVNLLLRYGICSADDVRAETTLPRQESERFIFLVS